MVWVVVDIVLGVRVGVLERVVELVCILALVAAAVIGWSTIASGQGRGRVGGRHVNSGRAMWKSRTSSGEARQIERRLLV